MNSELMPNIQNPFSNYTGADRIRSAPMRLFLMVVIFVAAFFIAKMGLVASFGLIAFPFAFAFVYIIFRSPLVGLYTSFIFAFILIGLGRYLQNVPIGLGMDGILILTFLSVIFKNFYTKVNWTPVKKDVTILALVWFLYYLFEAINPEARSLEAWFTGRSVALYMLLVIPLVLLLIDDKKKLDKFFMIWGIFSLLATIKGIMQYLFGVDPWERIWLNVPGNFTTHVLFGKLRVFSFLSDAGQFGANQGYSGVVAFVISTAQKDIRKRIFFIFVAIMAFYGLIISGTRGAISVPAVGFVAFFILRKNVRIMIPGFVVVVGMFVFFKYTTIGQGNSQIARMRSAFDPNNASLQVRLENQRKLKAYLATRPFGGGIGHAGGKARKFLPNAFLSNVPTDSWYVMIWAEMGIIGLILHLFILFYVILKSSYTIMFRIRDPILRLQMTGLASGMLGIMVASYGNGVLGQMPTSIYIYTSMALMLNTEQFDSPKEDGTRLKEELNERI